MTHKSERREKKQKKITDRLCTDRRESWAGFPDLRTLKHLEFDLMSI